MIYLNCFYRFMIHLFHVCSSSLSCFLDLLAFATTPLFPILVANKEDLNLRGLERCVNNLSRQYLPLRCRNWVEVAAVQCSIRLRCQMLALALTCSKSWNDTSWATTLSCLRVELCQLSKQQRFPEQCVWQRAELHFHRQTLMWSKKRMPSGFTWECLLAAWIYRLVTN